MKAVEIREIHHFYSSRFTSGRVEALKGINLSVEKGEIFGFLGPNGSGKTTLFKILSTLITPAGGSASIFGLDVEKNVEDVRKLIGVVFQQASLDKKLTVEENLRHQGHLYALSGVDLEKRIATQLEKFGLSARRAEIVQSLSGGLARRVELAKGLIHGPSLLILDEPSTGLDLGARRNLWETLSALKDEGVTILVTTHLAAEADKCDRLAILNEGSLLVTGTPDSLKGEIGGDVVTIRTGAADELAAMLRDKFGGEPMAVDDEVRMEIPKGHEFIPRIVEAFPGYVSAIAVGKPTLEDVFIHRTGKTFWYGEAAES